MKKSIYLHIGYPKAASTTLQKGLFNKHSQLLNLGTFPTRNIGVDTALHSEDAFYLKDESIKDFYYGLCNKDSSIYNEQDTRALYNILNNKYIMPTDKQVIFSNERITSTYFAFSDNFKKADRVKAVFDQVKVIIVIRKQDEWIKSQYRDHPFNPTDLSKGNPVDINEFIDISLSSDEVYYLEALKYDKVIDKYVYLFGINNVCVLLMEELQSNVESFCKKLSNFMCIDYDEVVTLLKSKHENTGVPSRYNKYRQFKRRYSSKLKYIKPFFSKKMRERLEQKLKSGNREKFNINDKNKNSLQEFYKESNKTLLTKYNLSVDKYKYFL